MEFLDVLEKPHFDNSIAYEKYYDFRPATFSEINSNAEIVISTTDKDALALLEKSSFVIDTDLTKLDGSRFADNDDIGVINNSVMFLFSQISLYFDEVEIERVLHPGRSTLCTGILNHCSRYGVSDGLLHGWYVISGSEAKTDKNQGYKLMKTEILNASQSYKGKYRFIIPFNHIFGFKGKVLMGMKYRITFNRVLNNDAIFRGRPAAGTADTNEANLEINDIVWRVPFLDLNDGAREQFYGIIVKEPIIDIPLNTRNCFHSTVPMSQLFVWNIANFSSQDKPYGLILFFQTGKSNSDQFTNPTMFDHCSLNHAKLKINQQEYPGSNLVSSFEEKGYLDWYKLLLDFRKNVMGIDTDCVLSPTNFRSINPMFIFDLASQKERITGNIMDFTLECRFSNNVPANTVAYALVLTNRLLQFQFLKDRKMKFLSSF